MQFTHIDNNQPFDWGRASLDYAKYRDVYPPAFYDKIIALGLCTEGRRVLDLGTGTGVLPRALYKYGAKFTGADISPEQIKHARRLSEGMDIDYIVSAAEEIDFPDGTFDTVTACQCFTYFNAEVLLPRLHRMLKPDGRFAVLSMVWLPRESEIAAKTEAIVLKHNPAWNAANYDRPKIDCARFDIKSRQTHEHAPPLNTNPFEIETAFTFDLPVTFTRESWHGRILACRGIGASALTAEEIAAFEEEHRRFLATQPESFDVPHCAVFYVLGKI